MEITLPKSLMLMVKPFVCDRQEGEFVREGEEKTRRSYISVAVRSVSHSAHQSHKQHRTRHPDWRHNPRLRRCGKSLSPPLPLFTPLYSAFVFSFIYLFVYLLIFLLGLVACD